MSAARFIVILAAGGAVLAPLRAFGHGLEFLTAKLTLLPDAVVQVEVTADFAGNPLVQDEAAARAAVAAPLQVKVADAWVPLDSLARPSLKHHANWASVAPPSLPLPPPDAQHALITATWRWQHPQDVLSFTVPRGNMHDVFLWRDSTAADASGARWMLLLAGDETRELPVLPRRRSLWLAGGLALVITGAGWLLRRRAGRQSRFDSPPRLA
jgi:hypothetical protein